MFYLPATKVTNGGVSENEIVFEIDLDGNFLFLNPAGEKVSGYSCEEARQMNVAQIVAPEFVGYVREQLNCQRRNRVGLVYEIEILTRDGRRVAVETSAQLICREDRSVAVQGIALVKRARDRTSPPAYEIRCLHPEFVFGIIQPPGTHLLQSVRGLNPRLIDNDAD
jgi:PAS domain S-box-containing protein